MKKFAVGSLLVLVAACGSNGTPSSPSNTLPTTVNFTAALNPANEVPPVTNADASGRGTGTLILRLTRDGAGTITGANAEMSFTLSSFPNGTSVILTHVHEGGPAVAGPARINTGLTAANALSLANGAVASPTYQIQGIDVTLAQQMIDNPNGFYFNVHTIANPGGAARGQLVKQ